MTDPQGYDTTVAVYNLDTSKRPDPSMFKIDYTSSAVASGISGPRNRVIRNSRLSSLG